MNTKTSGWIYCIVFHNVAPNPVNPPPQIPQLMSFWVDSPTKLCIPFESDVTSSLVYSNKWHSGVVKRPNSWKSWQMPYSSVVISPLIDMTRPQLWQISLAPRPIAARISTILQRWWWWQHCLSGNQRLLQAVSSLTLHGRTQLRTGWTTNRIR